MPRPNGRNHDLDVAALQTTKNSVDRDPETGKGSFSTVTVWQEGARANTQARTFEVGTDEPKALGGSDQAIDPMELLLSALGSCLTIGWATQAKLRGVTLRRLQVTVHAPFDLRGYLELDPDVRPGFEELRYHVEVDCDADPVTLAEIKAAAERTSPMFDNILHGTPVQGEVIRQPAQQP